LVATSAHIIGAGISGLVVAYELAKAGVKVIVHEKMAVSGGLARTERFDGYYIDAGPHLFHTSNPDIAAYWEHNFPGEFRFPALYGGNWIDGKIFDYPLTKDSVSQLSRELVEQIEKEWDELDTDLKANALSYKEYMTAVAGPTLQEMFYERYPTKLWGVATEGLSANWAPQRIEIRDERRPFHGSQWCGVALNGCGKISEILVHKIQELGGEVNFDSPILEIGKSDSKVLSLTTSKQKFTISETTQIISTLGINSLSSLLGVHTDLTYRSVKLVSFVSDGPDPLPKDYDWLYFQDPTLVFHRIGSQTRFSTVGIKAGLSITTLEVAYSDGDAINLMSDSELISLCESDLKRVSLWPVGSLVGTHVIDVGPVYPGYKIGFEEELKATTSQIDQYSNLHVTGSLAEFAYSDLQILFAKSLDLAARLSNPDFQFNHIRKSNRRTNKFNSTLNLDGHPVGEGHPPFLIGEIGLNHNGSVETAKSLVDAAVDAGFSAIKLQSFALGRASSKVEGARYKEDLLDVEESLDKVFDRLVFSPQQAGEVFEYARSRGMSAFSTPFDLESVRQLEHLNVPLYKISSMDLVNHDLIRAVATTGKPMIISTGMSSIIEIEEALEQIREVGNDSVAILHCVSSYPVVPTELNLMAIRKIADYFEVPVGFSDHSSSNSLIPAAIALGARVIEKHITLSRRMKGPDHIFSLEPEGMQELSLLSRSTFYALGDGRKRIMPSEMETLRTLRRSIFASQDLLPGTVLTREMLTVKSPGTGILPKYLDLIIGRTVREIVRQDFPVTWSSI
jgi:sialic acid synthase SpsE/protoporphyrinogen oxidase